jgi:hypothetical protein
MSLPDDLPPELLAGYADGELPPAVRERVEAWLAEHPEALDQLEVQEALGPGNVEFWRAVRPPEPTPADWVGVRAGLAADFPAPRRGVGRWAGAAALFAVAASITLVFLDNAPRCGQHKRIAAPVFAPAGSPEDNEPYPIARADEIRYLELPESVAPMLRVGDHPLKDAILILARSDEVDFHNMGCDAEGRFPEDPLTMEPPFLWIPAPSEPCPE